MHNKGHKLKTSPLIKNPQFPSNLADIQAKLPTREVINSYFDQVSYTVPNDHSRTITQFPM